MSFDPSTATAVAEFDPSSARLAEFDPSSAVPVEPHSSAIGNSVKTVAKSAVAGAGQMLTAPGRFNGWLNGMLDEINDRTTETLQGFPLTEQQRSTRVVMRSDAKSRFGAPDRASIALGTGVKGLADFYHTDPARAEERKTKVAGFVGGLAPAITVLPLGAAAVATGVAGQMGESARDEALAAGDAPDLAEAKAKLAAAVGASFGLVPGVPTRTGAGIAEKLATRAATGGALFGVEDATLQKLIADKIDWKSVRENAIMGGALGGVMGLPEVATGVAKRTAAAWRDAEAAATAKSNQTTGREIARPPAEQPPNAGDGATAGAVEVANSEPAPAAPSEPPKWESGGDMIGQANLPDGMRTFHEKPEAVPTVLAQLYNDAAKERTLERKGIVYRVVDDAAAAQLEERTGLQLAGFRHSADNYALRHIAERHGTPQTEVPRGQIPVGPEDIARLPEITQPENLVRTEQNARGQNVLIYEKPYEGTTIVVEEVREGRKELALTSLYKKVAQGENLTIPADREIAGSPLQHPPAPSGTVPPARAEVNPPTRPQDSAPNRPVSPDIETHAMASGSSPARRAGAAAAPAPAGAPLVAPRPPGALAQQLRGVQAVAAPQTIDAPARFAANLLRQLNARMTTELTRADYALHAYRNDFDRTPVLPDWQYDPAHPLPRNFAFIDAYESGKVAQLPPAERAAATEMARQNSEWVVRVHALGTGALKALVQDYFPHLWEDPVRAKDVIGSLLSKRPLEGSKDFLKQRTHDLFREGLEAGLKPAHDNPVDLWLLKKREVERYILGVKFQQQMKAEGLMKFNYYAEKRPEGWTTPRDPAFTQWGPPTVTVKEAFDAGMRAKTLEVLADLGVPHERLTSIGGKRWGYEQNMRGQPGTERITTKFGGPDFVIWHELGHALDSRYPDMREALFGGTSAEVAAARFARSSKRSLTPDQTRLLERDDQLRELADARGKGQNVTKSYQSYLRRTSEKMAVVLQAYLHAPELMDQKAPAVKAALKDFIRSHPELAKINDIKPSLALGEGQAEMPVGGLVKLGDWIMPEAAARVVDNYLSPGLNTHLWYRGIREVTNLVNAAQLSFSAFHLGFTSIDVVTSRLELAINAAMHGELLSAARTAASVPVSWISTPIKGFRYRKAVLQETDPALIRNLEMAGGRVSADKFWVTNFDRRMRRSFAEMKQQIASDQWLQGTSAGLKAAVNSAFWLVEKQMQLIHNLVAAQKLGVFQEMAAQDLRRLGPNAADAEVREVLRKAWDSVDNRMGQVVYDNYFYNKVLKDVALLSFRAFGWQQGKFSEGGGAILDTAKMMKGAVQKVRGTPDVKLEFTHKMGYALALPIVAGTIGAILHYLFTGKRPGSPQDYFQPQTGQVDATGNPERVNLPTYLKDAIAYGDHPIQAFSHSLNPVMGATYDLLSNRDFYNTEIHNPEDPLWKQGSDVAKWAVGQVVPFSVTSALKMRQTGAPAWKQAGAFFGVTPVPRYENETPMQSFLREARGGSPVRTQEQAAAAKAASELSAALRDGKPLTSDQAAATLGLSKGRILTAVHKASTDPDVWAIRSLDVDHAMRAFGLGNDAEKHKLTPELYKKVLNAYKAGGHDPQKLERYLNTLAPYGTPDGK